MFGFGKKGRPEHAASGAPAGEGRSLPTKVLSKFLAAVGARPAPVVLDLGPVVGSNVSLLGERLGCKLLVEDLYADLARAVRELAPEVEVETIPGVSSFAAAAAVADVALAEEDETVAVIPAAYGTTVIDHLLDEFDTLVLMKVKPLLDEVLELLERRDLLATSCFIEKVGAPEQRVVHDVASLRGEKVNYLSLLLVQNPKRARGELRRGCRKRAQQPTAEALS